VATKAKTEARPGVVERFLAAMTTHDWVALAGCVAEDVERVGPYSDRYVGRAQYVAFISGLLPTLPGYHMDVGRVVYAEGGRLAVAELSETVDVDGTPLRTPESLVFDIDEQGLIRRVVVYIQHPADRPR
jgi:ketosteroid isomerase-like protein